MTSRLLIVKIKSEKLLWIFSDSIVIFSPHDCVCSRVAFCIQNPRHCGGVKKSLSGEQRKEAPNVIIY